MLKTIAKKSFELGTAPARFVINQAVNQVDRAKTINHEIQAFRQELQQAQADADIALRGVFYRAAEDLSKIPADISPQEREAHASSSFQKADHLIMEATVEMIKGLTLLLADQPIKLLNPRSSSFTFGAATGADKESGNVIDSTAKVIK